MKAILATLVDMNEGHAHFRAQALSHLYHLKHTHQTDPPQGLQEAINTSENYLDLLGDQIIAIRAALQTQTHTLLPSDHDMVRRQQRMQRSLNRQRNMEL